MEYVMTPTVFGPFATTDVPAEPLVNASASHSRPGIRSAYSPCHPGSRNRIVPKGTLGREFCA